MRSSNEIKCCNLLLKDGIAYLNAVSETDFLKISSPPFVVVEWDGLLSNQKLDLIKDVLEGSKKGLKFPENPSEFSKSILKSFGFKSHSAMNKNAINCGIEANEDVFTFSPTITVRNGYDGKDGAESISVHSNAEEIISVLNSILEKCE